MTSLWPENFDNIPNNHQDNVQEVISANHVNKLAAAVNAMQVEEGTNPSGSYASVRARIEAIESAPPATHGDSSHDSSVASLSSGMVPTTELGGSGADSTKFLRGDRTWAVPPTSDPDTIPFVNIEDYGGAGDNSTDNATPFQDACAALPLKNGGRTGEVRFGPGKFKFTAAGITLPTTSSGWHDNGIRIKGAGKQATTLVKGADVILVDASGTISSGVSRTRVGFHLSDLELDGSGTAGWTKPLLRQYYGLGHYVENVRFVGNAGPAIRLVEMWDSGWQNIWIENCGFANVQSILAAWNGGTSILGTEPLQILSSEADPQVGSSTMGYSTDNCNNLYFNNLNISVDDYGHIYTSRNAGGGSPHNVFFRGVKLESTNPRQPFVRCYGLVRSDFQDVSMAVNSTPGSGVGSIDCFHLAECVDFKIQGVQIYAEATYNVASAIHLFASNERITIRDVNAAMISGGSGTAQTGRVQGMYTTASGQYGPRGLIWFENTPTNVVLEGVIAQTGSFTTRLSGAPGAGFRDATSLGPALLLLKAGAVVDGDFPVAQNGQIAYDSTNNQIYVRSGGTWRKTAALT